MDKGDKHGGINDGQPERKDAAFLFFDPFPSSPSLIIWGPASRGLPREGGVEVLHIRGILLGKTRDERSGNLPALQLSIAADAHILLKILK